MEASRRFLLVTLVVGTTLCTSFVHGQTLPPPDSTVAQPPPEFVPVVPVGPVAPIAVGPAPVFRAPPPAFVVSRFRTGRIVYAVGSVTGLIGSGLTLSSIIVTSVYGIDDITGPALAYAGSGASSAAVILEATGLGIQHSALSRIGEDPGRVFYGIGTLFGVLGLIGVGTSYYFGIAQPVENSATIGFATSITATVLLSVGGLLYFIDSTRLNRVYRRLTTF